MYYRIPIITLGIYRSLVRNYTQSSFFRNTFSFFPIHITNSFQNFYTDSLNLGNLDHLTREKTINRPANPPSASSQLLLVEHTCTMAQAYIDVNMTKNSSFQSYKVIELRAFVRKRKIKYYYKMKKVDSTVALENTNNLDISMNTNTKKSSITKNMVNIIRF